MKKISFVTITLIMLSSAVFSQSESNSIAHNVQIETMSDSLINEMFVNSIHSSMNVFQGSWQQLTQEKGYQAPSFDYNRRHDPKTKKGRAGKVLKGIAIGGAIGLSPAILSAIFGKGEGGAYVSVFTFPLGIITGGIIGATSKGKRKEQ